MHLKTKLFDEQDSPTWSEWKNFQLTLEFKICSGRLLEVHGYQQKSHVKTMLFDEQDGPTWSAWKKFWNHFRIQNLLWKTSLGLWISAEINRVVVRCVDRFLLRQTLAAVHFKNLVLFESTIFKCENDEKMTWKWLFLKSKKLFFKVFAKWR